MEKMRLIFEASDAPTVMATRGRTALAGGCAHADGSKDWGVLFFYPSINGTTTAVLKGLTGEFRHGKSPRKMAFEELRYLQEYYKTESQQCSRLFETYPEGAPYQEILSGWADHSLYFACQNQAAGPLDYANYRLRMIDRAGELSWSLEVTCGNPAGCRSRQGQMRFMEVEAFCLFKTGSGD